MAKETQSPKVKHRKPGRGTQPGDKVVHREKSRSKATSSASRPPAPGTNYMKDRNKRDWERQQRTQQKSEVLARHAEQERTRRQEAVRQRGIQLMQELNETMVSPSASANQALTVIVSTYLDAYIEVADLGWPERHAKAKAKALEGCAKPLMNFVSGKLDQAERKTRPARKSHGKSAGKVAATS